jgi:hypothetical protein
LSRPEATQPTSWLPDLTATENQEPLDRALQELVQNDQWIDDFIKRLSDAIDDVVRDKP